MFYYVYLDPDVVSEAVEAKDRHAVPLLVKVLDGFTQNCASVDQYDGRIGKECKAHLVNYQLEYRGKLMSQLARLSNNSKKCLEYPATDNPNPVDNIVAATKHCDVVLVSASNKEAVEDRLTKTNKVFTLLTYPQSPIEEERHRSMEGTRIKGGAETAESFFDRHFANLALNAEELQIVDRYIGSAGNPENYAFTLNKMFEWLNDRYSDREKPIKIKIHTTNPKRATKQTYKEKIPVAAYQGIEVQCIFYEEKESLPHDRFLLSDLFCISVSPGLDFLLSDALPESHYLHQWKGKNNEMFLYPCSRDQAAVAIDRFKSDNSEEEISFIDWVESE